MGLKIFRLFYISVAVLAAVTLFVIFMDPRPVLEAGDNSPESIITRIDTNNYALRGRAAEITSGCADKECSAYKLFTHIRDNKELLYENAGAIDKAVRLASYMENIDIPVQMVFTETYPYVLACGLDRSRLYHYILEDSLSKPFYSESVRLAAGQMWTRISLEQEEAVIAVQIKASQAVDLFIMPYPGGEPVNKCTVKGKQDIQQACLLQQEEVLGISAVNGTQMAIQLASVSVLEEEIPITVYKGRGCLPFDFESADWQKNKAQGKVKTLEPKR